MTNGRWPLKGSPAPHPSGWLRLAIGNLENLRAQDGQSTYLQPKPSLKERPRIMSGFDATGRSLTPISWRSRRWTARPP